MILFYFIFKKNLENPLAMAKLEVDESIISPLSHCVRVFNVVSCTEWRHFWDAWHLLVRHMYITSFDMGFHSFVLCVPQTMVSFTRYTWIETKKWKSYVNMHTIFVCFGLLLRKGNIFILFLVGCIDQINRSCGLAVEMLLVGWQRIPTGPSFMDILSNSNKRPRKTKITAFLIS